MRRSRRHSRSAAILLLITITVLLGVPAARDAVEQGSPGERIEVRANFGACHEGGGSNCVVDGDTVWIAGAKVRIAGIDAPETHEPKCAMEAELGRRSAERLRVLLSSGALVARPADRDRDPNGRLLRHIAVDGRDVGEVLIAQGLARAYRGGKRGWCG